MKTKTKALLFVTMLASLLVGAFILQITAPGPVAAYVEFDPDTIDLGAPGWTVKTVVVTVYFGKGKTDGKDIDPKTVLIEGVLEPKGGWRHTWTEKIKIVVEGKQRNIWVFRFKVSGSSLRELLWTLIGHVPGPVATIPLEVTGLLYNGDAFAGTGYITVYIPTNPPPPPPH